MHYADKRTGQNIPYQFAISARICALVELTDLLSVEQIQYKVGIFSVEMKLYTSLVLFTSVIVFAEAMAQNCQMLKCPVNKTLASSVAYTISTTEEYYEPKKPVTGTYVV